MFNDFDEISGVSANNYSDLRPGIYREILELYSDETFELEAFIRKFRLDDEADACVVEVLRSITSTGEMSMLDFMEMADGTWRRSDGAVAPSFSDLLPPEIKALRLFKDFGSGDVIEVKASGGDQK